MRLLESVKARRHFSNLGGFPIRPVGFMFPITGPGVVASPGRNEVAKAMISIEINLNLVVTGGDVRIRADVLSKG